MKASPRGVLAVQLVLCYAAARSIASCAAEQDVDVSFLQTQLTLEAKRKVPHVYKKKSTWVRSDLYFGLSMTADNGTVSNIEVESFEKFLADVVTPVFPDGLTWSLAQGQYLSVKGLLRKEKSVHLILYHGNDDLDYENVNFVAAEYCKAFDQESVLVSSEYTGAIFVSAGQ